MKRIILLSLLAMLAGCATYTPMPVEKTNYCAKGEIENCRQWTPSERTGAGSRGHSESPTEKLIFYKEPEVIFKDEHTPGTCRSPFR